MDPEMKTHATFIRDLCTSIIRASMVLVIHGLTSPADAQQVLNPTVILVSIDGFRYDYIDSTSCPNLRSLAESGVRAKWLIPIFPTKTFPNHYSQVAGLYAENHGIVGNTMYDPSFDVVFSMGNRAEVTNGRWWGGEPIWVTAEKQGQKSAMYFWPGSEARIATERPTYWARYDGSVSYEARVQQVLNWLDYPERTRPTLISLYFSAVDDAGHEYGPVYAKVDSAVKIVDEALGLLIEGLKERKIFDSVNIIVTSDHGMTATAKERTIYLDDYVDFSSVRLVDRGILVSVWAGPEKIDSLYRRLSGVHPHLNVFRKSEIPDRWRYKNHPRVAPLFMVAGEGWIIRLRTDRDFWKTREHGGDHGYDNALTSMRGIFVAGGPAFARQRVVDPVETIQIYNLISHILGIIPAPNDGHLDAVSGMLR